MSLRMSADEAWRFVAERHSGVLTTLRADGTPISLPVWFVVDDRTVCLSTPPRTKKVARIRNDPRAAFLVESGAAWAELAAVHLSGRLRVVEDEAARARVRRLLDEKYAAFRLPPERMPAAARATYAERVVLRLVPEGRMLTWDNARLLGGPDAREAGVVDGPGG